MLGAFRKHTKTFFWAILILLVPAFAVFYVPRQFERTGPRAKLGEMFGKTVTVDEYQEARNAEFAALRDLAAALQTMEYRKPQYDFLRARRDVLLAMLGGHQLFDREQARDWLTQAFTDPATGEYDAAAYAKQLRETGLSDEAYLAEYRDNLDVLFGIVYPTLRPEGERGTQRVRQTTWQRLVLAYEAQRLNIPVGDDEVLNYLGLICPGEDGTIDQDAYAARVRELSMDRVEFERMLRTTIRIAKLERMVLDSVRAPQAQVTDLFDQRYSTYKLAYHLEAAEPLMEPDALRDDEVLSYYVKNRGQEVFQIAPKVAVLYVLVEAKAFYPKVKVPDAELRAYYDAHQQDFAGENAAAPPYDEASESVRAAVQAAVVEASYAGEAERLARAEASRLFQVTSPARVIQEAAARGYEVHQTPLFGREGPIDGLIAEDEEAFRDTAFRLKLGTVSRLVRVAQGWCVLASTQQVPDARRVRPFSQVADLARTEAARARAEDLAQQVSEKLFEQVEALMHDEGLGFVEACSRLDLAVTETGPLDLDAEEVPGLKDGQTLIYHAAVAKDWLADGAKPQDVYVTRGLDEGTVFFHVLETQLPDKRVWAEKGPRFTTDVLRALQGEAYGEWFETLWVKAKIKDLDEERRRQAQAAQQAQGGGPMPQ